MTKLKKFVNKILNDKDNADLYMVAVFFALLYFFPVSMEGFFTIAAVAFIFYLIYSLVQ